MFFESFAQNGEDVLLNRVFPGNSGFYIDVGAADPVEYSVTKAFYDRGWRGINVEPQNGYFADLLAERPRDLNLQIAISDAPGEVTFFELPDRLGWATINSRTAEQHEAAGLQVTSRTVPAITLAELCECHVDGPIDFLKIDVEGAEPAVLRGGDFQRWRPRVVVVEATEVNTNHSNSDSWETTLLSNDYLFAFFDGLNRFYVRAEDRELLPKLQYPANLLDRFVLHEHLLLLKSHAEQVESLSAESRKIWSEVERIDRECRSTLATAIEFQAESTSRGELLRKAQLQIGALEREAAVHACDAVKRAKALSRLRVAHETALNVLRATRGHLEIVRAELHQSAT